MNCLNPFFAFVIFIIALSSAWLMQLKFKLKTPSHQFETIDGLRGFLAFGIFIHHACIWRSYSLYPFWELPRSNLYIHLGQTCVSLFFMITGFLFISKLINSREEGFDWKYFFISRIYRLVPLYIFIVLLIVLIVMILSHWSIQTSIPDFIGSIGKWLSFTIVKSDINHCRYTFMISAGVTWSLPYEWLFYFSLPLIGLILLKKKPPVLYLILSLVFSIIFLILHSTKMVHIFSFLGGMAIPFLLKYTSLKEKIKDVPGSLIIVVCIALLGLFDNPHHIISKLLTLIIFALIAFGCSLFGLLKTPAAKFLGAISYSTYLLHGIVLFVVLFMGFGLAFLKGISDNEFCLLIFGLVPLLVLISYLSFQWIEKPFMNLLKKK